MFDLELSRTLELIKKENAKRVVIQLPAGLKPRAEEIVSVLEKEGVEVFIWLGSCFGACDIPQGLKGVDLMIQYGHNLFHREEW